MLQAKKKNRKVQESRGDAASPRLSVLLSAAASLAAVAGLAVSMFSLMQSSSADEQAAELQARSNQLDERLATLQTPLDYSIIVKLEPQNEGTMQSGETLVADIDNDFAYSISLTKNEGQLYSLTKIDLLDDEFVDVVSDDNVASLRYDIVDYGNDWSREVFEFKNRMNSNDATLPLFTKSKEWNIPFSILMLKDTSGNEYWGVLAIPFTAKGCFPSIQKHPDGTATMYSEADIEKINRNEEALNAVFLSSLELQSDPRVLAERILDSKYVTEDQLAYAREQRTYFDCLSENGHLFREVESEELRSRIVSEVSQMQTVFDHVLDKYGNRER